MKPVNPERHFLSIEALALRWALAEKTIRKWIHEGKLPFATKLGGVWRFPLDRVETYEKQRQVRPQ